MIRPTVFFLFLLGGFILPHVGLSQETARPAENIFSLSDCIQKALSSSPSLEVAEYDRWITEAKLQQAKSAYLLPEIKLQAFGGPVPDLAEGYGPENNFPKASTSLAHLGPFIRFKVEALQPLYTFGKLSGAKEAARQGVEAKKAQEVVAKNELIFQIKRVYFGLTFLLSMQEFVQEIQENAKKTKERVEEQIAKHSPEVTDIDRMRIDVFVAEADRRAAEAKNGITVAFETLRILMGLPAGYSFEILDKRLKMRSIELQPVEYYLERAKVARPEIRQLDNAVAVRRALLKVSRSDFFPSFFLGGFYSYGKAPDRAHVENPFLRDDFNYSSGGAALGLEQKLGFHLTHARYREASAEYNKMLSQKRQALQGLEIEIRKTYLDGKSKQESVKNSEIAYKAGRSWVMASTLNFGVGLVPVKDLLEAFIGFSKVKGDYMEIMYEYEVALAALTKAVGEEVGGLTY